MALIPILMPKMSMTMTEGEVSSWLVKVGDRVAAGDVVCEVLTDKVDMEVESTSAGTLVEIVAESGTVAVGEPIGYLEGEDDGLGLGDLLAPETEPEPAAAAPTSDAETLASDHPDDSAEWKAVPARSGPVAAVPRARGLARERGIDLATVTGTGPDGLVTVADVDKVRRPAPAATSATTATAAKPQKDRGAMIRAAVARKMTESAGVPQFTVWRDLALDAVDVARRRQGVSWTTSLLQAYAGALRDVPDLLSRWDSAALDGRGAAVPSGPPAVALAVATEGGLLVPVFVEPDARDPRELDAEVKQVVAAANSGRLDPAYLGVANG